MMGLVIAFLVGAQLGALIGVFALCLVGEFRDD